MKRLSVVILVLGLLLLCSTGVLAFRHGMEGEGFKTDTWYSISPTTPYWQAAYERVDAMDASIFIAEWHQKDQMFVEIGLLDLPGGSITELVGSYLFDFGLFLGLDYQAPDPGVDSTWFSVGYRYDLGEDGYLALSADYLSNSVIDEIMNYDLDLKYYTDLMFVFAEITAYKSEYVDYNFGINYQLNDLWVGGAEIFIQGDYTWYGIGFTLTTDPAIVDFSYGNTDGDYDYDLSAMFNLTASIGLGFEYFQVGSSGVDPDYTLNFKYTMDTAKFKISYMPENDSHGVIYALSYFAQL